jgi:hypothetical protein
MELAHRRAVWLTVRGTSVIETCRLRQVNPWNYIAEVIALARQGISPPTFPAASLN